MSMLKKMLAASGGNIIGGLFQVDLYVGNGTSQSITNGLDLSSQGGLVWIKNRDAADFNVLSNTETGITDYIRSDNDLNEVAGAGAFVSSADTNGFSIGAANEVNTSGENYVSRTWKEAPGFFKIESYTGDGIAGRTVAHGLEAVPGVMLIKQITGAPGETWNVYHTAIGATAGLVLSSTAAEVVSNTFFNDTAPTSSVFTLGGGAFVNGSGKIFVAFLFSEDNPDIMQMAEYTGNGSSSGPSVVLGWKPQFVLIKGQVAGSDWVMFDGKRGDTERLNANLVDAEDTPGYISFTNSGFDIISANIDVNQNTQDYIYLAIRQQ